MTTAPRRPGLDTLAAAATDALYVTVGFGLLAFQRAQVRRRELEERVAPRAATLRTEADRLAGIVRDPLRAVDREVRAVEERVDAWLDVLQPRLPRPLAGALGAARELDGSVRASARAALGLD